MVTKTGITRCSYLTHQLFKNLIFPPSKTKWWTYLIKETSCKLAPAAVSYSQKIQNKLDKIVTFSKEILNIYKLAFWDRIWSNSGWPGNFCSSCSHSWSAGIASLCGHHPSSCGARVWTQGLWHARLALCQWSYAPAQNNISDRLKRRVGSKDNLRFSIWQQCCTSNL